MNNVITKCKSDHIDMICRKYYIRNYSINSDGSVDLAEHTDLDLDLSQKRCRKLPLIFGKALSGFDSSHNGLTTLVGSPHTVVGNFLCYHNSLTSLEGAPNRVSGSFYCNSNPLRSTYSGDDDIEVEGEFICYNNELPQLLKDNLGHIKLIIKYQRYFEIWNNDLSLNEENFMTLLSEIEDGLL